MRKLINYTPLLVWAGIGGMLFTTNAHALDNFRLICDSKEQITDVLDTLRDKGNTAGVAKFREYFAVKNQLGDPLCVALTVGIDASAIASDVTEYRSVEFMPNELYDIVVIQLKPTPNGIVYYATISQKIGELKKDTSL